MGFYVSYLFQKFRFRCGCIPSVVQDKNVGFRQPGGDFVEKVLLLRLDNKANKELILQIYIHFDLQSTSTSILHWQPRRTHRRLDNVCRSRSLN